LRDFRVSADESSFRVEMLRGFAQTQYDKGRVAAAEQAVTDYLAEIGPFQALASTYADEHSSWDERDPCPLFAPKKIGVKKKRKRSRKLQKRTVDEKIRKVEKILVRACEEEELTYLQAMRLCDIVKGRFSDLKNET